MKESTATTVRAHGRVRNQRLPRGTLLAVAFAATALAILAPKAANAADVVGGNLQSAGTLTLSLDADPDQRRGVGDVGNGGTDDMRSLAICPSELGSAVTGSG